MRCVPHADRRARRDTARRVGRRRGRRSCCSTAGRCMAACSRRSSRRWRSRIAFMRWICQGTGTAIACSRGTLERVVDALERGSRMRRRCRSSAGRSAAPMAMAWAQRAPSRIARLVLVCATPKFVAAPDWPRAMTRRDAFARFADELRVAFGPTLLRFLTLQVAGERGGSRRARWHACTATSARGELDRARSMRRLAWCLARDRSARRRRRASQQPALVIAGARDTLVPPRRVRLACRARCRAGALQVMDRAAPRAVPVASATRSSSPRLAFLRNG